MLHSYMTHPQPLDIEKEICKLKESTDDQMNILSGNKGIAIDTLSEFYQLYIDSDDSQDPLHASKVKDMEKAVSKTCLSMGYSVEAYYERIALAYNQILKTRLSKNVFNLRDEPGKW